MCLPTVGQPNAEPVKPVSDMTMSGLHGINDHKTGQYGRMTALDRYVRLESGGIWRAGPDAQRKDVVISFGDATLVISDKAGRPLSHWSLPAVTRQNPGKRPAVYTPDDDGDGEAVEVAEDTMIDAIEEISKALTKARPKPGQLRQWITGGLIAGSLALAVFWLPDALMRQTLAVVPMPKRAEIGTTILGHMQRETGTICRSPNAMAAADRLSDRLFGAQAGQKIVVVPMLARGSLAIPGGIILLDYGSLQAADDPAVAAGHVLAGYAAAQELDPLEAVLDQAGLRTTLGLLTTGDLPEETLAVFGKLAVTAPWQDPDANTLLPVFEASQVPTTPYAAITGADLQPDPMAGKTAPPILNDADWVSLQNICN